MNSNGKISHRRRTQNQKNECQSNCEENIQSEIETEPIAIALVKTSH